jgi:hypothetical protein
MSIREIENRTEDSRNYREVMVKAILWEGRNEEREMQRGRRLGFAANPSRATLLKAAAFFVLVLCGCIMLTVLR